MCDASLHGLVAKRPCSHQSDPQRFFPQQGGGAKPGIWRALGCRRILRLGVGKGKRLNNTQSRSVAGAFDYFFGGGRGVRKPRKKVIILLAIGLAQYSTANCHLSTPRPSSIIRPPSLLYLFPSSILFSLFCVLSKEPHSEDTPIDCTFRCQLSLPLLTRLETAAVAAETLQ